MRATVLGVLAAIALPVISLVAQQPPPAAPAARVAGAGPGRRLRATR